MKHLKFPALACCASLALALAARAQSPSPGPASGPTEAGEPGEHHHGHGGLLQMLTNELGLTDAQKAQIAPILQDAMPKMKAIHDQAQTQRKQLIDSVSTQITPILTSDQQTHFQELVQKAEADPESVARQFGGGHHGESAHDAAGSPAAPGPHGGGPLQHMVQQLGLSPDQQAQIKPILDGVHTQIQAIRQDTTLTQEQKFAKMKETMDGVRSRIGGILTPDQLAKMDSVRQEWKAKHRPGAPGSSGTTSPAPSVSGT